MSVKASLKFPSCLIQGDHISLISIDFGCPDLTNSSAGLVFSNGLELTSADPNQMIITQGDSLEEWTIEVKMFSLDDVGLIDYQFYLDYSSDENIEAGKVTVYKGSIQVEAKVS